MDPRQPQLLGSSEPQRLLKAKVQVCGRFLLSPDDDFGAEKADELVRRVLKEGARIRTTLQLFNTGMRLGENGIFASMPLEHIKYQRIVACISPRQQNPRILAVCTQDYDQKCVTILQFKDPAILAEASRLIDRQRRLAAEETNYLSDSPVRDSAESNWALESAQQKQQQQKQQAPQLVRTRPESFSATGGFPGFGPLEVQLRRADSEQLEQQTVQTTHQVQVHHAYHQQQCSPEARVAVSSARDSTSSGAMDDVFYHASQQQLQRRHYEIAGNGEPSSSRTIDSVIINYDDLPSTTEQQQPRRLVQPRGGSAGVITSLSSGTSRPTALHVQTSSKLQETSSSQRQPDSPVRPRMVASGLDTTDNAVRPQVTYVTSTGIHRNQQPQPQPQQQLQLVQLQQPQSMRKLVRLVPVRRRIPQQQLVALQPVSPGRSSLGRGYYQLVTK